MKVWPILSRGEARAAVRALARVGEHVWIVELPSSPGESERYVVVREGDLARVVEHTRGRVVEGV